MEGDSETFFIIYFATVMFGSLGNKFTSWTTLELNRNSHWYFLFVVWKKKVYLNKVLWSLGCKIFINF